MILISFKDGDVVRSLWKDSESRLTMPFEICTIHSEQE